MKKFYSIVILVIFWSCIHESRSINVSKTGCYVGLFNHGNFSDSIQFIIEKDSMGFNVFFTSLEQNASRIPLQEVDVKGDSIIFKLQSDFYTYEFKNKWIEKDSILEGRMKVDTVSVDYTLQREVLKLEKPQISQDVNFSSSGLNLQGTIWYPKDSIIKNNALIIVTSSGNSDRSSSRSEAILLSEMGHTIFHYDKRGTGLSEGDWESASMDVLLQDDINAINYFSSEVGIPLSEIGIKGSSQGATKIPFLLNELPELKYGIAVSCPGSTLLESDLNYWKNRNSEVIGKDIAEAKKLQRKVFEHIAGSVSKLELETLIELYKFQPWFEHIWIPNLNDLIIDTKLLYSPIPYFKKVDQPILVIQGTLDQIIPSNSHKVISDALEFVKNNNFEIKLLEGASHSMNQVGDSDFPYWSKIHSEYLKSIEDWIKTFEKN